jgi:hypothetical protein
MQPADTADTRAASRPVAADQPQRVEHNATESQAAVLSSVGNLRRRGGSYDPAAIARFDDALATLLHAAGEDPRTIEDRLHAYRSYHTMRGQTAALTLTSKAMVALLEGDRLGAADNLRLAVKSYDLFGGAADTESSCIWWSRCAATSSTRIPTNLRLRSRRGTARAVTARAWCYPRPGGTGTPASTRPARNGEPITRPTTAGTTPTGPEPSTSRSRTCPNTSTATTAEAPAELATPPGTPRRLPGRPRISTGR